MDDAEAPPFQVKPSVGLLAAGELQLIALKFTPPVTGRFEAMLTCMLNNSDATTEEVLLIGRGAIPALSIGPPPANPAQQQQQQQRQHDLYLKPTCVGLMSQRAVVLRNSSRVPVVYSAQLPGESAGVFSLVPACGSILGNDCAELTLGFAPRAVRDYRLRLPIEVRAIGGQPPDLTDARQLGGTPPAPVVETRHVTVHATAGGAAIAFDPAELDFGVSLVKTRQEKTVRLINSADCDVAYELAYATLHAPCGDDAPLPTSTSTPQLQSLPPANSPHAAGALLLSNKPRGVIASRSTVSVTVTFQPDSAGAYRFNLLARLCGVDAETGARIMTDPSSALLLRLGDKQRAIAAAAAAAAQAEAGGSSSSSSSLHGREVTKDDGMDHSAPGMGAAAAATAAGNAAPSHGGAAATAASDSAALAAAAAAAPLLCGITARASFPTVMVSDARVEGGALAAAATAALWQTHSLARVNALLSAPLTDEEIAFNCASTPDMDLLPRFPVAFVPSPRGERAQVLLLQLRNPGHLPTDFSLHFPNERDIELELWADEGEPSAAQLRQSDIIDKLQVFEVTPRRGTLLPGQGVTLRLGYSYTSLLYDGRHDLPVLLRIAKGKQLWLHLQGITLPSPSPHLHLPLDPLQRVQLHPIAVGTPLSEAPCQTSDMFNTGDAPLAYAVEPVSLEEHGIRLLRLDEATSNGVVAPRSVAQLKWRFVPLEAKTVEVAVRVRYRAALDGPFGAPYGEAGWEGGGSEEEGVRTVEFKLVCTGYDPRGDEDPHSIVASETNAALRAAGLRPPHLQTIAVSPAKQPATLSAEHLAFGRLPQGSTCCHRVLVLRNVLQEHAVEFDWLADEGGGSPLVDSGAVSVEPMCGKVPAGGHVLVRVSVNALCAPTILSGSLPVVVRQAAPEVLGSTRRVKPRSSQAASRAAAAEQQLANASKTRETVVSRTTVARTAALNATKVPQGRASRMPAGDASGGSGAAASDSTGGSGGGGGSGNESVRHVHSTQTLMTMTVAGGSTAARSTGGGGATIRSCSGPQGSVSPIKTLPAGTYPLGASLETFATLTTAVNTTAGAAPRSSMGATAAAAATARAACVLHVDVCAEVVREDTFRTLFGAYAVGVVHFVPRPRPFVRVEDGRERARSSSPPRSTSPTPRTPALPPPAPTRKELKAAAADPHFASAAQDAIAQLLRDAVHSEEVTDTLLRVPRPPPHTPLFEDLREPAPLLNRALAALGIVRCVPPRRLCAALHAVGIGGSGSSSEAHHSHRRRHRVCRENPLLALAYAAADAEAAAAEAAAAAGAAAPAHDVDVDALLQQLPRETVAALEAWLDKRDHAAYLAERAAASGGGNTALAAAKAEAEVMPDLSAEEAEFALSCDADAETGEDNSACGTAAMTDGGDTASTAGLDSVGGVPGTAEGDSILEVEVGGGGAAEAHLQSQAALMIQAQARRRAASKRTAQLYADAVESGVREAAADPEVQVALSAALENTLFNLFQEALAGEFDLTAKPLRSVVKEPPQPPPPPASDVGA